MMKKALSLVLAAMLLVSAMCFMAPSAKATTNILTNGDFESGAYPWGSPTLNSDAFQGSYSCSLFSPLTVYQDYSYSFLPSTNYNLSMAYKTNGTFDIVPFFIFPPNYNGIYLRRFTNGTWINLYSGAFSVVGNYMIGDWNVTVLSVQTSVSMYSGTWRFMIVDTVQSNVELKIDNIILTDESVSIGSLALVAPSNGSSASSLTVNFTYTPILSLAIVNSSLWLNSYATWQRVANTTTVSNGTLNNFTYALPYQGVYLWNIQIWDVNASYFAPANYTLTVQSETTDYGNWFDSCENVTKWTSTNVATTVDHSDYQEGWGSMNFSWNLGTYTTASSTIPVNYTSGKYFGFFMKLKLSDDASVYINLINSSSNEGWYIFAVHSGSFYKFNLNYWRPTPPTSYASSYVDVNEAHWYWIEFLAVTGSGGDGFIDGISYLGISSSAVIAGANQFKVVPRFQVPNNVGSVKLDFLRIANTEEYPVFTINTINVVSNPEFNSFFSMATNSSSLQTETLCVNGNVSENMGDLGHVGTYPWLDSQDDNTSYVQTNLATATYDQYYTFNQTTLLTISSATLHVRLACFPISDVVGVLVQVYLWDGSSYVAIEGFQRFGDWITMNSSALFTKGFNTPEMLNQMRLKIWMNLNQQVPGMTYMGRCSAIWLDVYGYGSPEGFAIHQTPYSFNPVSATYIFNALNMTLYDSSMNEFAFQGFNYTIGSYVGSTLVLTSLSGITSITLEYSLVPAPGGGFLIPFMFMFWIIGLVCMFISPIYAIDKIKKREYLSGFTGGVVFGAIGFALFIAGLWGITV